MRGTANPADWLTGWGQEVGVLGVGDQHKGPLAQGDVSEGEEVMVEGKKAEPKEDNLSKPAQYQYLVVKVQLKPPPTSYSP